MSISSRIKSWWLHFKTHYKALPREDIVMAKTYQVNESTREAEVKKRVNAAFDAQEVTMNARALKAHSCQDPIGCVKRVCFKRVPDKIVSKSYAVDSQGKRVDSESK